MNVEQQRENFQYWLAEMDSALERFLESLPPGVSQRLDFKPESLAVVEEWIIERYPSISAMLALSEREIVDGLARYIGETFRKVIGGRWEIRLDDPNYVYHGRPQLTGFSDTPTPISPHSLATASADRRTGRFMSGVLSSYLRDQQRQGKGK